MLEKSVTLTISKQCNKFVVDNLALPGSPPVGRGRTVLEAMGSWLMVNQDNLGISFDLTDTVQKTENRRRVRELKKR